MHIIIHLIIQEIVSIMELPDSAAKEKKMEENKRMIEEAKQKMTSISAVLTAPSLGMVSTAISMSFSLIKALVGKKIPILTLDNQWHKLFTQAGENEEIQRLINRSMFSTGCTAIPLISLSYNAGFLSNIPLRINPLRSKFI